MSSPNVTHGHALESACQRVWADPDAVAWIVDRFRQGVPPKDGSFDVLLPDPYRARSAEFWTDTVAAFRVARWLDAAGLRSFVDVGSGVGKLATIVALCSGCRVVGIEQRAVLVDIARDLARTLYVDDRVRFVHEEFAQSSVPSADAYYFFNPFLENKFAQPFHLDGTVPVAPHCYTRDVRRTESFLRQLDVGKYVLTYNGLGCKLPASFELVHDDRRLSCALRVWMKVRMNDQDRWIDEED